jgi:NitT/TauT family transport system permease protein
MTRLGWLRLGVVAALIGLLEALCRMGAIGRLTMIPPSDMAVALVKLLQDTRMLRHIGETLRNVAVALVLALAFGFVAGVVIRALPRLRRALEPLLATWYAVPFFMFYPLLIVIFGLGDLPVIMVGFLFAVVAMIVATLNGLDRVPRVLGKVARVHRLSGAARALLIDLPCAAPYLLTGAKLALAYSFIGVIASEFIMSGSGLGHEIAFAYNNFDNRTMYGLMLLVIVLVTAANMALHVYEQRQLRKRSRG